MNMSRWSQNHSGSNGRIPLQIDPMRRIWYLFEAALLEDQYYFCMMVDKACLSSCFSYGKVYYMGLSQSSYVIN